MSDDGSSRPNPTPFGAWASPISARDVAEGARRIDDIAAAGDDVCWIERRPEEGGRNVLVRRGADGETRTLTPDGFDVRSRVHEYGGGAFCLLCPQPAATPVENPATNDDRSLGAPPPPGTAPPLGAPAFWPASAASRADLPHAFVNFQDQRVYLATSATTPPTPLTPADGAHYADLVFDPHRHRLIAVQERPDPADGEEIAALVAIPLPAAAPAPSTDPTSDPPPPTELVSGADFYSSPRLSPDGARLAWLSWNHPDMPWDATELRLAGLDDAGLPAASRAVAGGDPEAPEAVQQPSFDAHGRLTFISDRTGWWNLYRLDVDDAVPLGAPAFRPASAENPAPLGAPAFRPASGALPQSGESDPPVHPLHPRAAEFGVPPWLFGMSTYAHTASGIVAACCEQGVWSLLFLPESGPAVPIPTPYTSIMWLRPGGRSSAPDAGQKAGAPSGLDAVLFLGAAPDRPAELVRLSLSGGGSAEPAEPRNAGQNPGGASRATREPVRAPVRGRTGWQAGAPSVLSALETLAATGPSPDPRYLSRGRPLDFPSAGGRRAFAFFYPPKNDDAHAPDGARPPLIVKSHGGPTSAAEHVYDTGVQYWTSRGFAVVDVNYGGSTGYGRAYRESLRDRWGIVDVEDCAAAAEALADRGEVDARQLLIRGGSAGGYTTLAALAFKDAFAAGASHYGVADLSALARDTHKFESRYLDRLVGPYPERSDLYDERSPLSARDGFSCPVIFFQGAEDRIVPPNQAESMVEALRARGVPVAYLLFEGEQHGFRRAGNIVRALESELSFYGQVLGFEPAGPIEPVTLLGPA